MEDTQKNSFPKIAVTVLVFKDGKVLLGERIGDVAGAGMYNAPGGHLESMESLVACGAREVYEETGVEIENVTFLCVTNVTHFPPKHFVLLTLRADWKSGIPTTREPHRCSGWKWFPLSGLPSSLTPATASGINSLKTRQTLFDNGKI